MSYAHFTEKERYVISHMKLAGFSLRAIGRLLVGHHMKSFFKHHVLHLQCKFTLHNSHAAPLKVLQITARFTESHRDKLYYKGNLDVLEVAHKEKGLKQ